MFSPLAEERFALALETIYEGYLLHYGVSRLFAPADRDTALLLGDALYAQGLVHLAALGETGPVGELAALISLCAQQRGDGLDGDGEAWADTATRLGGDAGAPRKRGPTLWRRTPACSAKVAPMAAPLAFLLADAASEGRKVVLSMLVVGLIILAVIALGELDALGRQPPQGPQGRAQALLSGAEAGGPRPGRRLLLAKPDLHVRYAVVFLSTCARSRPVPPSSAVAAPVAGEERVVAQAAEERVRSAAADQRVVAARARRSRRRAGRSRSGRGRQFPRACNREARAGAAASPAGSARPRRG